jgi:hypothetical protein
MMERSVAIIQALAAHQSQREKQLSFIIAHVMLASCTAPLGQSLGFARRRDVFHAPQRVVRAEAGDVAAAEAILRLGMLARSLAA